ncbi:MAG: BON domain-containing protein, partial [Pseudomonadota bacterium]
MVRVLLGLWVVVAGLTFYSALWYKSGSIEADITTKTEAALAATNLAPVRLDVDGRHVRLSGHLYAEDDRARYVSAVQEVGGALGPSDGLILREPHGFITAQQVGDVVSLSGSVPDEETKRALLEAVQQAVPGGTLEDHLAITGGTSEMAEMLTPALAVLGHLNSGQLTVTPDQRSTNGQAALPGYDAVFACLVGPETGWTGRVVPASRDADLAQRVAELTTTLGEAEAAREALSTDLAQAQSRVESLTAERTAYADATQNLSDQILALKASTVDMSTFDTAQDRLALLESQSALQARTIGAARVQTTEQSTRLSTLADQLSRLEQQTVLQARTLGAARAQVQEEQSTIQSLIQERDGLTQSLKVLEPQARLQAKTIGAARRQVAASATELAELTKAKDALEAQLDDLTAQSRLQAKTIGAARVFATET